MAALGANILHRCVCQKTTTDSLKTLLPSFDSATFPSGSALPTANRSPTMPVIGTVMVTPWPGPRLPTHLTAAPLTGNPNGATVQVTAGFDETGVPGVRLVPDA